MRAYNAAGRAADGLRLAAAQLSEERTRDIYRPLADQLRRDGQLRKAEQIYIGLGEPDEAISMYKVTFDFSLESNKIFRNKHLNFHLNDSPRILRQEKCLEIVQSYRRNNCQQTQVGFYFHIT